MFKEMNVYKKILIAIIVVLLLILLATFAFPKKVVSLVSKLSAHREKVLTLEKLYSRNLTSDMRVYYRDGNIYYHKDLSLIHI